MWSGAGHDEFLGEHVENVYTAEAGTARVNVDRQNEGGSVVLEIEPNSGYDLNRITVFPASAAGQESDDSAFSVDITDPESYPTFEMPGYDVDVRVYFYPDQSQE